MKRPVILKILNHYLMFLGVPRPKYRKVERIGINNLVPVILKPSSG